MGRIVDDMIEHHAKWRATAPDFWAEVDASAAKALARYEFVRSHYRAAWYGIILHREKRKGAGDLCTVRVLKDRRGNWVRKPWTATIDEGWLVPCTPWRDPDAPYNLSIPVMVAYARRDAAKETLRLRAERKRLRRQLRGYE